MCLFLAVPRVFVIVVSPCHTQYISNTAFVFKNITVSICKTPGMYFYILHCGSHRRGITMTKANALNYLTHQFVHCMLVQE